MAKSDIFTAVRNLMGEFNVVKITNKNLNQRRKTLQNEEEQQQVETSRMQKQKMHCH